MYTWVGGYSETWEVLYTKFRILSLWLFFSFISFFTLATVIMLGPNPAFSVRKDSTLSIGTSAILHHIVTVAHPQVKAAKYAYLSHIPAFQVGLPLPNNPAFFLSPEPSVNCSFAFSLELKVGLLGLMLSYYKYNFLCVSAFSTFEGKQE